MSVSRGKFATVPEPTDVNEVGGCFFEPGHSRVAYESKSCAALPQKVRKLWTEPAPVTYLDGVGGALGKLAQERVQDFRTLDRETGRKLEESRTKLIAKDGHDADEASSGIFAADEALFVCDLLGVLYTTHKRAHSHTRCREIAGR